jgi:hypothetical protein
MRPIAFRFFFLYFLLTITPWFWFYILPGVPYTLNLWSKADQWLVELFNTHLLHVRDHLNSEGGGSGDTSFAWAEFYTYLILSAFGCLVWTLIDRKREKYTLLDFILKNIVRYNVIMIAFSYGIIKLFALQMPAPNLNQLATPLGDFLPMRLSWMFMGYSTTYQVFSGIMEILVGALLLNRKTVTFGSLLGVAVFTHVFLLNLSFDIPVKLYSMQIVIMCVFLTAYDGKRIVNFLFLNKTAAPSISFDNIFTKKWQGIARVTFKIGFMIMVIVLPFKNSWDWYKTESSKADLKPITSGVYAINTFVKNNDTIPILEKDEQSWKDFIFEKGGLGSVNTSDTLFMHRYRRGYFSYQPDTVKQTIKFMKYRNNAPLFELHYKIPDDRTIDLWGIVRHDSVYIELARTDRHFQLMERQFHWISEANR